MAKETIFDLSPKSRIRVAEKTYNGKDYTDVRHQFLNEHGEWIFTKKGVSIPKEMSADVAKAIAELH